MSVDITPSSTFQMQGLTRGDWDLALTAFDNLLASATREGVQSTAFAITDVRNLPFLVRPEIQSYEDLRGKALAADAVDTALALVCVDCCSRTGSTTRAATTICWPWAAIRSACNRCCAGETVGAVLTPPGDQTAREARAFGS